jgi:acetyl esterase/lipase
MKTETIHLQTNENVTLTTYLLDASEEMPNTKVRPAVLIFPGGGYRMCSDREAEPVAMAFLAQGYHAFVLRYSLNENAAFPKPLNDAEAALELIRRNAGEWGVTPDKIAVCGFSAGGHLAAALGTMGRIRPNALILGYPCILDSISDILPTPVPSLEKKVDAQTPPVFIFSTANDVVVPVDNSLQFAAALDRARIPFELHIFQDGTHGLSLARPHTSGGFKTMSNPQVAAWMELCIVWLENLFGGFPADRVMPEVVAAADATEYSIDLPLEICWANPDCRKLILTYLPELEENPNLQLAMSVSLRVINEYSQSIDESILDELDRKLKALPFSANQNNP